MFIFFLRFVLVLVNLVLVLVLVLGFYSLG